MKARKMSSKKRNILVFVLSAIVYSVLTALGGHYLANFAYKGSEPQTWEQIGNSWWIFLITSFLFAGYATYYVDKYCKEKEKKKGSSTN